MEFPFLLGSIPSAGRMEIGGIAFHGEPANSAFLHKFMNAHASLRHSEQVASATPLL